LRFLNFATNYQRISRNPLYQNKIIGLTKFSDMSREEFLAQVLRTKGVQYKSPKKFESLVPSKAIDWVAGGCTTAVMNQGQCGGVFDAITETIESINCAAGKTLTSGSTQQIENCAGLGCDGIEPVTAFAWVKSNGGIEARGCYALQGCTGNKCPNPNPNLILDSIYIIPPNELSIYQSLNLAPIFVCVDAVAWQDYNGGILPASGCGTNIDHCVQLTGYSPTQGGYWILRNSWGVDWGENGFIYLQYGGNACGITSYAILANSTVA